MARLVDKYAELAVRAPGPVLAAAVPALRHCMDVLLDRDLHALTAVHDTFLKVSTHIHASGAKCAGVHQGQVLPRGAAGRAAGDPPRRRGGGGACLAPVASRPLQKSGMDALKALQFFYYSSIVLATLGHFAAALDALVIVRAPCDVRA